MQFMCNVHNLLRRRKKNIIFMSFLNYFLRMLRGGILLHIHYMHMSYYISNGRKITVQQGTSSVWLFYVATYTNRSRVHFIIFLKIICQNVAVISGKMSNSKVHFLQSSIYCHRWFSTIVQNYNSSIITSHLNVKWMCLVIKRQFSPQQNYWLANKLRHFITIAHCIGIRNV